MDRQEAGLIADAVIDELRSIPYATLSERFVSDVEVRQVVGPSGTIYQVEIHAIWDNDPGGPLRVIVGVDDGSFRGAFRPVGRDLLIESPR
jgi:hypothetical protein